MVVLALASLVLLIVSGALGSTARLTALQAQRSIMQGRLQTIANEVERTLQRSCAAAIRWRGPTAAEPVGILAAHTKNDATTWDPSWRCIAWDSTPTGKRRMHVLQCPPEGPALTAPALNRAQAATPAELAAIAATNLQGARLLGEGVSDFAYSLETGPLARILVVLEAPVPGRKTVERIQVERLIHLRNRV